MSSLLSTMSLILASGFLGSAAGVFMLAYALSHSHRIGTVLALSPLLTAVGVLLYLCQIQNNVFSGYLLSNAFIAAGFILYSAGFEAMLTGRTSVPRWLAAYLLVLLLLGIFTYPLPLTAGRNGTIGLLILYSLFHISLLSFRESRRHFRNSVRVFAFTGLSMGIFIVVRTVLAFILGDILTGSQDHPVNQLIYLILMLHFLHLATGFVHISGLASSYSSMRQKEKEAGLLEGQKYLNRVLNHDITGPMGSLYNLLADQAESIREGRIPDGETMDLMADLAYRSMSLLQKIGDIGKYQLQRELPRAEKLLLAPQIWSAGEAIHRLLESKSLEVSYELDESLEIHCETHALQTMLRTILEIMASRSPSERFIIVQMRQDRFNPGQVLFSFRDQGEAIDQERINGFIRSGLTESTADPGTQRSGYYLEFSLIGIIANNLGWTLDIRNHPQGGLQIDLEVPVNPGTP